MASCLGLNGGENSIRRVCHHLGKVALSCGLTSILVGQHILRNRSESDWYEHGEGNFALYLTLAILVGPICCGVYWLVSSWRGCRTIPGLRMLLTTLSSAAIAVYLLPLFLFYVLEFIEYLTV